MLHTFARHCIVCVIIIYIVCFWMCGARIEKADGYHTFETNSIDRSSVIFIYLFIHLIYDTYWSSSYLFRYSVGIVSSRDLRCMFVRVWLCVLACGAHHHLATHIGKKCLKPYGRQTASGRSHVTQWIYRHDEFMIILIWSGREWNKKKYGDPFDGASRLPNANAVLIYSLVVS